MRTKSSKAPSKPSFVPDKARMKDSKGGYFTQSLFLEMAYTQTEFAVYSLADYDKCHKGIVYPSLRRLYLEMEDPTEYLFATTYLWGWDQWQKMVDNKLLFEHIQKWRDELEVKLRAKGVAAVIAQSNGNFNAAKWVADGNWEVKRGRPSKAEREKERAVRERAAKEGEEESSRILQLVRKE